MALIAVTAVAEPPAKEIQSLIRQLGDKDPMVRSPAAVELGKMGQRAAPAVPKLIELLADEEGLMFGAPTCVCDVASEALSQIGGPAVAPLVKATESRKPSVRANAAAALARIQPLPKDLLAVSLRLLRDPEETVRRRVLEAIARVKPPMREVIPAVADVLANDADSSVRSFAAGALGILDKEGTKAVPKLIRALSDENPDVRATAAGAIGSIGPAARAAVAALDASLSDDGVCWVHETIDMARQRPVRYAMVDALGKIGPAAAATLPKLKKVLQSDGDAEVRAAAAVAMLRIEPTQKKAQAAIVRIIEASEAADTNAQTTALCGVAALGASAAWATKAIKDVLRDAERSEIRTVAAMALVRVAPRDEVVPLLVEQMQEEKRKGDQQRESDKDYSDDHLVRESIAEELGEFGPGAARATAALAAVVADVNDDLGVRLSAAAAIERIGPAARDAVPQLTKALSDKTRLVRCSAAAALGAIGSAAKRAIPKLVELSKSDPNEETRCAARMAAEQIVGGNHKQKD